MVRIGIVGCGGIANGRHIPELLNADGCKITALCDTDGEALKRTAERIGIDEAHCFEDYKKLAECEEVDAVEICTPNHLHVPIAEYVVSLNKPANIEKPLALCAKDAQRLENILKEKKLPNMMCFTYRFFPAVRYAKHILDKELIGKIVGIKVEYLKSSAFWEGRRLEWRFVKKYAGTGVLGDLGVHLIDMTRLLVGDFQSVGAMTGIIVKQRLKLDCDELADVETDDWCNFTATVRNKRGEEIPASFSITRCALGHANTIRYDIFGTDGTVSFDANNPDVLEVCLGEVDKECGGMHTVSVPDKYRITQEQAFADMLNGKNCEYLPTIDDGIACQKILDAVLLSSEIKQTVDIE